MKTLSNRTNSRTLLSLFIFTLIFLLSACAPPRIKQNVTMPAKASSMKNVKKLALVDFGGDRNRMFSTKLEAFFGKIKVKGAPYFTVVDRHTLSTILQEQKMVSESGLFNENDAAKLGELSGADTIISGVVSWPKVEAIRYKDERQKCVQRGKKKRCTKWQKYHVNCTKKQANVSFTVKAISVQKGEMVFTENYTGQATNKFCSDTSKKQVLNSNLQASAMSNAMGSMRRDVAPYNVVVTIELMDDDDSDLGDNKKAKKLLKSGIQFAKQNRLDRGCEQFRKSAAAYNQSPAIYHNLGVCAEIEGDLQKSQEFYKKADRLLTKPHKMINKALSRIARRMESDAAVASQMR